MLSPPNSIYINAPQLDVNHWCYDGTQNGSNYWYYDGTTMTELLVHFGSLGSDAAQLAAKLRRVVARAKPTQRCFSARC